METIPLSRTTISKPWLTLARAVWVVLTVAAISLWAIGTVELTGQPPMSCMDAECDPFELTAEDMQVAETLGLPSQILLGFWNLTTIVMALIIFGIAGIIFWQKSNDWVALLVSFTLVFLGSVFFTESDDALVRSGDDFIFLLTLLTGAGIAAFSLLLFTFPDGQFVPGGKFGKTLIFGLILVTSPLLSTVNRENNLGTVFLLLTFTFGLGSQIYRYRRASNPIQRQQTKWVVAGLLSSFGIMLLWILSWIVIPPNQASSDRLILLIITRPIIVFLILVFPITLIISILRYRLWDVDILIRKTLVYGILTGLLLIIYFSTVISLQNLLTAIGGRPTAIVTVISTLVIAALFNPLRRRIQDIIDRRFFRRRYDAEEALADFSLSVRDEVDLESLSVALLSVVDDTMQPESVSVWLKEGSE